MPSLRFESKSSGASSAPIVHYFILFHEDIANDMIDKKYPEKVIARTKKYFIKPQQPYEITGQVNNVVFIERLTLCKGKHYLYYGTAESYIAAAVW
jgi:hypothetical protein